jgi:hypothetical protein
MAFSVVFPIVSLPLLPELQLLRTCSQLVFICLHIAAISFPLIPPPYSSRGSVGRCSYSSEMAEASMHR